VKKPIEIILFLSLLLLMTARAFADCSVTTTPVIFGNYDPFTPTPLDTTGSITVNCDKVQGQPLPVTISISASSNSGVFIPRQMKHSSRPDVLNYNLYTKQNRTTIWGDGTGGTSVVVIQGVQQRKETIYATIPPQQNVRGGFYTDSLTVSILW
jgi:spore coat protein U domain-containing protein, fimbrial subunit CupE1/2/3/6